MPAFIDLSGRHFGRWTVLRRNRKKSPGAWWVCRCDPARGGCGAVKTVNRPQQSAGCMSCSQRGNANTPLTYAPGDKVHSWTIKGFRSGEQSYVCECACGTIAFLKIGNLNGDRTKECQACRGRRRGPPPQHLGTRSCDTCGAAFVGPAHQKYCHPECRPSHPARRSLPVVTKLTPFRLPPETLDELAALAASNGGNLTTAVKESAAQFRALVEEAGRANAEELTREEWVMLGHLDDPDPFGGLVEDDSLSRHGIDWSQALAVELVGTWEGRDTTLPLHKAESKECAKLAKRIAGWGRLRGYALMCALRHFWRHQDAGIESCAAPEVWMTPTAKEKA